MTAKEFQEKYMIKDEAMPLLIDMLDALYLEFTREQVLNMVQDFLDNADDIFNSDYNFNK